MVPKALELRVTVVGERLFTAAVHSQERRRAQLDWRLDQDELHYTQHQLPASERRRCLELVRGFDLEYATLDLVVRPDGGLTFLELNPNGQYLWLEQKAGLPISDAIADHLMGLGDRREMAEPDRRHRGASDGRWTG